MQLQRSAVDYLMIFNLEMIFKNIQQLARKTRELNLERQRDSIHQINPQTWQCQLPSSHNTHHNKISSYSKLTKLSRRKLRSQNSQLKSNKERRYPTPMVLTYYALINLRNLKIWLDSQPSHQEQNLSWQSICLEKFGASLLTKRTLMECHSSSVSFLDARI